MSQSKIEELFICCVIKGNDMKRKMLLGIICAVLITGNLLEASPTIAYAMEESKDEYVQEEGGGEIGCPAFRTKSIKLWHRCE